MRQIVHFRPHSANQLFCTFIDNRCCSIIICFDQRKFFCQLFGLQNFNLFIQAIQLNVTPLHFTIRQLRYLLRFLHRFNAPNQLIRFPDIILVCKCIVVCIPAHRKTKPKTFCKANIFSLDNFNFVLWMILCIFLYNFYRIIFTAIISHQNLNIYTNLLKN